MEYQLETIELEGLTLVTYKTLDGKVWVTATDMANATGVDRTRIKDWARRINKVGEFLVVRVGQQRVEARAYPLESLVDLLNYLQDNGHIKPRRFALPDLMSSLEEVRAIGLSPKVEFKAKTVYLIRAIGSDLYKIGFTARDVTERLKALQTSSPHTLTCLYSKRVSDGRWLERILHNHYATKRMAGEWFNLTDIEVKECIDLIKSA